MVNLKCKPFMLSDKDIKWVQENLDNMTLNEKVGQLFCLIGVSHDESIINEVLSNIKPGGIMYRAEKAEVIAKTHSFIQEESKIPLLISANLEEGGSGIGSDLTNFSSQMGVCATNDSKYAYMLGDISSKEGGAVGCNWTFSPVVDINMNYRNPITNIRAYSDKTEKVIEMSKEYMRAMHNNNMAVTIKHFPGDGVDERDHHLVTSVNSLTKEEWDSSFGKVYGELIENGADAVMVGHITLPNYQKYLNDNLSDGDLLPASLSKELLQGLLRERLNFNGLIVTDSSLMMGLYSAMRREEAVPKSIAAGCDMFLFARDLKEDFGYMLKGVKSGIISEERLNEAVKRILGLKASLGLHKKKMQNNLKFNKKTIEKINFNEHRKLKEECIKKSITLVKDRNEILPINPKEYSNILIHRLEGDNIFSSKTLSLVLIEELEKRGFNVELFDAKNASIISLFSPIKEFKEKYDLVIYISDKKPVSNNTTLRLNYNSFFGADFAWSVQEIPNIFISFGSPYHLEDMPMIKTFINCYNNDDLVVKEVVKKLTGESEFLGKSPVDTFCGFYDTKL